MNKEWKDLTVQIPGEPIGQGRPRFTKSGHAYKDKKSAAYENLIALAFDQAYPGWNAVEDPVEVYIRATYPVPVSWPKRKKLLTWLRWSWPKTNTPDIDNIAKAALDGLKGVWKNDSQVVALHARKLYTDYEFTGITIHVVNVSKKDRYDDMTTKELEAELQRQIDEENEEENDEIHTYYREGSG